jgi:hypothetical protein
MGSSYERAELVGSNSGHSAADTPYQINEILCLMSRFSNLDFSKTEAFQSLPFDVSR